MGGGDGSARAWGLGCRPAMDSGCRQWSGRRAPDLGRRQVWEWGGGNGGAVCGEPAAESKRVHQYSVRGRQLRRRNGRVEGRTTWIPRAQIEQNEPW